MKATLEFSLPEEKNEFMMAQRGEDLFSFCREYADWMRSICKYQDESIVNVSTCRDKFYELLRENSLELFYE